MKTPTKGPWIYAMQKDEIRIFHVAYGAICNIPHDGKHTQEHEANATLIAAAPEMLEALEKLLPKLSQLQDESAFTWPEKIETLINKAKGL